MSSNFKRSLRNDTEATAQLINKLFGKIDASLTEAGIIDAKEAFDQARVILRSTQIETNNRRNAETKKKMLKSDSKLPSK